MRIVIDGAHGAGKTTFLYGKDGNSLIPCVKDNSCRIFTDLIGKSFYEGINENVVPPKSNKDFIRIFELILKRGREQFLQGTGDKVFWYDRGIHFINVIAEMENQMVPKKILSALNEYIYDYVFVFEPIESYDFTKIRKAGFRTFTIADRRNCVNLTYNSYKKVCDNVFIVPVFSNDLSENYYRRLDFIKSKISKY